MTFKLNGVDRSGWLAKYGYSTSRESVIAKSLTDLNGITHDFISRWKSHLVVTLRPMTDAEARALAEDLSSGTVAVTYYSAQQGAEVTEIMRCVTITSELALQNGENRFWSGGELEFEQR